MASATKNSREGETVPEGFEVARDLEVGRYSILAAFPNLDRLPAARKLAPNARARARLFGETSIELVDQDLWMYVSPRELPKGVRREWRPIVSPDSDCIVVGANHLRESPLLTLYMDIFHELCHVLQRREGANLWPPGVSYVERWTEVEAYRFVIEEARAMGVSDEFLREYLRVEWISDAEHRELLSKLGVPPA
jgi:hypothetical protein